MSLLSLVKKVLGAGLNVGDAGSDGLHFKQREGVQADLSYASQATASQRPVIYIEGDAEERPVYTYIGSVLKELHKGDEFYADVVKGPLTLISELHGGSWDVEDDCVALAYKGHLFGSFNFCAKTLIGFIDAGCSIKIKCKHDGWYERPIPEILMQLPTHEDLWYWRDLCIGMQRIVPFEERDFEGSKRAYERARSQKKAELLVGHPLPKWARTIDLHFEDEGWHGPYPRKTASVDVGISVLPVAAGSKARPHLLIEMGNSSCVEISARRGAYKELCSRMDDGVDYAFVSRIENCGMSPRWCLSLIFLDKAAASSGI